MEKHINSPMHTLSDGVKIVNHTNLKERVSGFPAFSVIINEDKRNYFFKDDGLSCDCGQRQFMFGYIESNNSMNAYCIHCHKKQRQGVKLIKNVNARSNNHLYYTDHQKKLNRFFCECCTVSNVPLNVHHITEVQFGGSDDEVNLQLLCKPCHDIVHALRKAVKRGL